jgi:hypothetical protein
MQVIGSNLDIQQISSTLFVVDDFFTDEARSWLLSQYTTGHDWQFEPYSPNRLARVVRREGTGDAIVQATEHLISTWQGQSYSNQCCKLFFDARGYRTGLHADSAEIEIMLQIYLESDYIGTPGTIFHIERTYQTQFRPGSGYININTDGKMHESATVTHGSRKSFVGSYFKTDTSR